MRLSGSILRSLCEARGLTLGGLLKNAGVSRTAYYSLARKDSVLPKSIEAIARRLDTSPSAFLEDERRIEAEARSLLSRAGEIVLSHPDANLENVRHTLLLLQKEPIERLRRALIRAQAANTNRP